MTDFVLYAATCFFCGEPCAPCAVAPGFSLCPAHNVLDNSEPGEQPKWTSIRIMNQSEMRQFAAALRGDS